MASFARRHDLYICAGTIPVRNGEGPGIRNESFLCNPKGEHRSQSKIHMTRFESVEWFVNPGDHLKVFETSFGKLAITICYDVEFPELARAAALAGADLLLVPGCTDDRQGFLRVRYCAHERTIENQLYVIHASTVGSLPMVPAVSLNYGQASILTPSDFPFARDRILAEGLPNQETMVIGELNLATLREARRSGTVLPLRDRQRSADVTSALEAIPLGGSPPPPLACARWNRGTSRASSSSASASVPRACPGPRSSSSHICASFPKDSSWRSGTGTPE